ncbi:MAG: uridine phosphorylase [Butyricicoccaceae bacterium]
MLINGKQMHIHCTKGDVGRYVILPGDPGRCADIAALFDDAKHIASNREYTVYTGTLEGVPVSVCSTGIGGPSAAIALEELVECGADTFIRVGTSGGIDDAVLGGHVVVATGAVRQEGTTREYMPIEYPAVSDFTVTSALKQACESLGYTTHVGVIQSKDSFYGEIRPQCMPVESELRAKWEAWKRAGVLTSEMESAALMVVSACLRVRFGAVLNVLWNADAEEEPTVTPECAQRGVNAAVEAIRLLIRGDQK